jgi:Protein of unknown function (DUF3667)
MIDAVGLEQCPNCGARLTGPYCAQCGQKTAPINPTVRHFAHELAHELLHFDGKIFRSAWLLIARPGFLTREVLAGRRARHVSPIRLYLVFSIAYFALASFAPTAAVNITTTVTGDETAAAAQQAELQAKLVEAVGDAIAHWVPRAMAVLVPVLAVLVMLLSGRRERHYPQHLYFALHTHAAWFFAAAVSVTGKLALPARAAEVVAGGAALYVIAYFGIAFRRVYQTGIVATVWRSALAGGTYFVIVVATLMALFLPRFFAVVTAAPNP